MRRTLVEVMSLLVSPSGQPAVRVALPANAMPVPGQVMLGCSPSGDDALRHMLLPIGLHANSLTALQPEGTHWQPGGQLDLLGPVGHGFSPSPARRHWLLAAMGVSPDVLLPALDMGLGRGVGVAMWADSPLPPLPPQVEISHDVEATLRWADYVALATTPEWLETSGSSAPILEAARRPAQAEALLILPMPCGTGICGACAVGDARTALRACVDGPVLPLGDLAR